MPSSRSSKQSTVPYSSRNSFCGQGIDGMTLSTVLLSSDALITGSGSATARQTPAPGRQCGGRVAGNFWPCCREFLRALFFMLQVVSPNPYMPAVRNSPTIPFCGSALLVAARALVENPRTLPLPLAWPLIISPSVSASFDWLGPPFEYFKQSATRQPK